MMEKVILAGLRLEDEFEYKMAELEALTKAAGAEVLGSVEQQGRTIDPGTFLGKGKVQEIKELAKNMEADSVIFLQELSGSQIRNLEKIIETKVLDRTMLILDIFAGRAASREGKLQVHLAQLNYRLPRLIGFGNALSREGGGIGTRGPGEQKMETDRRHIMREIDHVKAKLKEVERQRDLLRERRRKNVLPLISLFGYTNSGKSTLMNGILRLSGNEKEVFAKDMLFATLETRLRRCEFPKGGPFLLTDTVGLVSDLPTEFVEAFSSTLEEAKDADLILHVVDCAGANILLQIETTLDLMKKLGLNKTPILTVFNKKDLIEEEDFMWMRQEGEHILISAKDEEDVRRLLDKVQKMLGNYKLSRFLFPYTCSGEVSALMEMYAMDLVEHREDGIVLSFVANERVREKYKMYLEEVHA